MYTRTITYEDLNGKERKEEHLFHLTKTELMEIAMDLPEGLTDNIEVDTIDPGKNDNEIAARKILAALGGKGVVGFIKDLILRSYGVKSLDGRRFEKTEALRTEFSQSLAFDQLYYELMTDEKASMEFINGVIPANITKK